MTGQPDGDRRHGPAPGTPEQAAGARRGRARAGAVSAAVVVVGTTTLLLKQDDLDQSFLNALLAVCGVLIGLGLYLASRPSTRRFGWGLVLGTLLTVAAEYAALFALFLVVGS